MPDYKLERGLLDILMKSFTKLPEDQQGEARLKYLADTSAMKHAFSIVYDGAVRRKVLDAYENQNQEYQKELFEIACEYLPNAGSEEKTKYIKALMGFHWLLNN